MGFPRERCAPKDPSGILGDHIGGSPGDPSGSPRIPKGMTAIGRDRDKLSTQGINRNEKQSCMIHINIHMYMKEYFERNVLLLNAASETRYALEAPLASLNLKLLRRT